MTSLSELELNRQLYKTQPQTVETLGAETVASNIAPAPSTAIASGNTVSDVNTNSEQINGDVIAPGTVPLDIANFGWTQTCAFSVVDSNTIQWGSGVFTSADGNSSYSISAGNTGNMGVSPTKYYIYLDTNVSTTAYQVSTSQTGVIGLGKVLIAVCESAVSPSVTATYILVQATQIVADNMIVNTLSAISADLGAITAGTITGVLIRTALTGRRIEITSSPTNTINFYDDATLYGSLEVDKTGSDGYIKLLSQDGAGLEIYTGIGASSFGSAALIGQGGRIEVSGNASNSFSSFVDLNGASFNLHGGPGVSEITTDDGLGNPVPYVDPYFTGNAIFDDPVSMGDVLTYKTTPMPRVFHGYVNSGNSAGTPFPSGWTVSSSPGTGRYKITHDLSSTNYTVMAIAVVASGSGSIAAKIGVRSADFFEAILFDDSGTATNADFMFILCRTA